jgi:non-ribosomal peptide synthetase component E (peptide arylation enzyme)
MPDPIMGQRVCAYIVPETEDGLELEELVSFLRSRQLAPYKFPERLEVMQALPMVSDTKVDKKFLAADIIEKLRRARGI